MYKECFASDILSKKVVGMKDEEELKIKSVWIVKWMDNLKSFNQILTETK